MGIIKRMLLEEASKSYNLRELKFVCPSCVTDSFLARVLESNLEANPCSYCDAEMAADLSVLLEEISCVIHAYFVDPAEELPYESREGGYQGSVLNAWEVIIHEIESWTHHDDLLEDVAHAFAEGAWCKRDYFGLTKFESLVHGWQSFAEQVKFRTRYLFLEELGDSRHSHPNEIPPGKMLAELGRLFIDQKMISDLPADTEFYRVRVVPKGERPATASEMGTAPRGRAVFSNRMSPAGIAMFYAAFDKETAILETVRSPLGTDKELAVARFSALRPLKVLNLTMLPEVPSVFNLKERHLREPLMFLHSFERELTEPVELDERRHTEYVPTQIVTEYVRHRLRSFDGKAFDGIIYRSSRPGGSMAVVLFAEPEHCGPRDDRKPFDPKCWLDLRDVSYGPPPRSLR